MLLNFVYKPDPKYSRWKLDNHNTLCVNLKSRTTKLPISFHFHGFLLTFCHASKVKCRSPQRKENNHLLRHFVEHHHDMHKMYSVEKNISINTKKKGVDLNHFNNST